jgi:hypothetical protein
MCRQVREIKAAEASQIIAPVLKLVDPKSETTDFLCMVEDSSALLVQKELGVYGFAHLTFQEYLASLHIKEEKLVNQLSSHVDQTWWHETARLYAAQADASPIVEQCLAVDRPSVEALLLASDCEEEALELSEDLRLRLHSVTAGAVEDADSNRRRHAAEYLLERRLRDMQLIGPNRLFDRSPITHAEYQLFIDEMRTRYGEFRQPDHWRTYEFVSGTAKQPILGLRKNDAELFCRWLTGRKPVVTAYSLPSHDELRAYGKSLSAWPHLRFFSEERSETFPLLKWEEIREQIHRDRKGNAISVNAADRLIWFRHYLALVIAFDRALAALARALDRALTRYLDRALLSDLARDLASALDRDLDLAGRYLDRALLRDLDLAGRDLDRAFDRDLDLAGDLDLDLARDLDLDRARALAAFVLNWLCVVEKRANGELPVVQSLWVACTLGQPTANKASFASA